VNAGASGVNSSRDVSGDAGASGVNAGSPGVNAPRDVGRGVSTAVCILRGCGASGGAGPLRWTPGGDPARRAVSTGVCEDVAVEGGVLPLSVVAGAVVPAAVCRWGLCPRPPGVGVCVSGGEMSFSGVRSREMSASEGGGACRSARAHAQTCNRRGPPGAEGASTRGTPAAPAAPGAPKGEGSISVPRAPISVARPASSAPRGNISVLRGAVLGAISGSEIQTRAAASCASPSHCGKTRKEERQRQG